MEERKAATFRGRHQRLAGGGLGPAVEPTLAAFATLAWLRWAGRGSGSSGGPGGDEKFSSPDSKTESISVFRTYKPAIHTSLSIQWRVVYFVVK